MQFIDPLPCPIPPPPRLSPPLTRSELLSNAINQLPSLREVTLSGCTSVRSLDLTSPRLESLALVGTRTLRELDARCPRLAHVAIAPDAADATAPRALRRVSLRSAAVRELSWAGSPCLETVTLSCPNLTSLDLSDCPSLRDDLFRMLTGGGGGAGCPCPALRTLRLAECGQLRRAALALPALEELQLGCCGALQSVEVRTADSQPQRPRQQSRLA